MGLFDFLKPKKEPLGGLTEKDPRVRRILLYGAAEIVATQADNLRAVGRKDDADKVIADFLKKVFQEFRNEPQNPRHLSLLTDVALRLGAVEAGKKTLESVIEENDHLHLDLTLVYTDLGRVHHDLRGDQNRELWCYEMATEAKAPPGCKFPATRQQKARAHHFAQCLARLLSNFHTEDPHWEIAESHMKRTKELVPELNWDDSAQVIKFMRAD
jgi:hypothetical protein